MQNADRLAVVVLAGSKTSVARGEQPGLAAREPFAGPRDLVFCSAVGDYLDPSALRRRYRRAQRAAGLRPLRFHDRLPRPTAWFYYLKVSQAREVVQVWRRWRGGREPASEDRHEAIRFYAMYDGYLPI